MEFENLDQLAYQGYTVIKGLSEEEVEYASTLFKKWWGVNDISKRKVAPHGIIKHWGVGHTAFAWYIRTRPCVQAAWAAIYGTRDLVVSFDGACYMPPDMVRNNREEGWLHVDQAANNPDWACVQGFVSLTSNTQATLGLVSGSHLEFAENVKGVKYPNKRYNKLPHLDTGRVVRVPVDAGDIVLWDSRVAHMNFYGPEERLVQYVSFLPRDRASAKDLRKRQQYWRDRRTTSHWAYPVEVVGTQPQTYKDKSLLIDYSGIVDPISRDLWDQLTPQINKLI